MRFVRCQEPFSTADAEAIEVRLVGDRLEVSFAAWHEHIVRLAFPDTIAFRWDPVGHDGAPRDDEPYEVLDSSWVAALVSAGQISSTAGYRHFKLCFNAASVLDVIAREIQIVDREA